MGILAIPTFHQNTITTEIFVAISIDELKRQQKK